MQAHGPQPAQQRQRGSMAVAMMLMLLGLVTILGIVEVGYLYWAHRDAQKVADLAALSGVQQLPDCTAATNAASSNAINDNGFKGTPVITCGSWGGAADPGNVSPAASSTAATNTAVKVVAQMPLTPLFGFAKFSGTDATAVAANTSPIAAFSVGTTLASVNGSATLPQLLQSIGINLGNTNLVGYQGLANVNITPAGLLKQLGIPVDSDITVGDLNTLLAAKNVSIGDLLDAIVTVAGQQDLANANVSLISSITAAIPNLTLQNVTLGGPGGLFAQIVAPDNAAQTALNAQVNVLQLISTAIGVATGQHAVGANTPISIPGLLNITATTSVIEPPSIGIGGVGTTAYTAQVRTFIHISTPNQQPISLLGGLISLNVNLPIAIDLVDAQGTLTDLCSTTDSSGQPQATIAVNSSLLKMCVGNMTQADAFSTVGGCDQIPGANTPTQLFALTLGNNNLGNNNIASLNTSLAINPLPANGSVTLSAGQTAITGNPLDLGTTANNLVTALTAALIANANTQTGSGFSSSGTGTQTATDLWNSTSGTNAARVQQALNEIQSSSQGLQGLLGNVTGSVLDLLGNTVQLNVSGLLGNVGNLLGGLVGGVTGTLNYIGCVAGSSSACIAVISGAMTGGGSGTNSNAFVSLLGFLLQALQPYLNGIGSQVLTPVLQNTLGLNLGQTTVSLQSLQCHRPQLVY